MDQNTPSSYSRDLQIFPRFPSIFAQFARLRIFERSWYYRVRVQSENAGISLDVSSWCRRSPRLRWLGASGGFRMGVVPRFATVLFPFASVPVFA